MGWDCSICGWERDPYDTPQELAEHLMESHDEWLRSHQVPPPRALP